MADTLSQIDGALRSALVTRRRSLGLSQTEAGDRCRPPISQQTISEMETGAASPLLATLLRYCRQALGCRVRIADL